jgi:hypothetical protein
MAFEQFLRLLSTGSPVRAGTVNQPLRTLDQNVKYIWDVLQAAAVGSTVYARRQTVDETVKKGMAVYLDAATQKFAAALAVAEADEANGVVTTAPSAQVWGVVADKINATLADILLFGVDTIDLTDAVTDGPPGAGVYYLSGWSPGKLTRQKPPVSVAVLRRTPDGRVFVQPQFVDFLDRHTHYKFKLTCEPAGTASPPTAGARHTLTDPDDLLPGWLPADHPSFDGKAPAGAVYGYNLAAHPGLKNVWPPVPVGNAHLEWNKALSTDVGFTGVPLGTGGLAVLDRNGIWWMSDCYGDVPWPLDFDSAVSTSYSDSVGSECPRHTEMELTLYFTKVNFATDSAVVLSLHSGDARLKVHCYGDPDNPASTGHLQLDLDLNLVVTDGQDGYLALKEFDADSATFKRGPVAEGVYALSDNVNLSGSATATRTIDSVERTVHQGLVAISVDPADTKELDVQLVRLDGAEEAYYGTPPVMYLEFVAGDEREYRGQVHVPFDLAIATPQLKLRFEVLGRAAGTLPQLEFTGRIVPRPADGLDTPLDLPDDAEEFSITCDTAAVLADTNQYVEAESEPFDVAPGDTVYFTVRRAASDGYAGAVGVLRQAGVVVSGA